MRQSWEVSVVVAQRAVAPVPLIDVLQSLHGMGFFDRWLICDGIVVVESSRKLELVMERLGEAGWTPLDGHSEQAKRSQPW